MMVFGITCPRCDGRRGGDCELCEGKGDQWMFRCPASLLSADVRGLLLAYGAFQNGILPDPGGLYDQSASFVHSISLLAAEKGELDEMERGN